MKLKALFALPLIAMIAACSGGSGGGNSGGTPTPPTPIEGPASNSIADLASYAAEGTKGTNSFDVSTSTNIYQKNGKNRTVVLQGTEKTGLLSVRTEGAAVDQHTIIGSDATRNVPLNGYYVGEANGSLRMTKDGPTDAVSGTASVAMDANTGKWGFGADLWRQSGDSGVYIGADNGTVEGNTMVFKGADSVVVDIQPEGVTRTTERADARAVFSDDGKQVFGKINGKNDGSGFMVDTGFAGKQFQEE